MPLVAERTFNPTQPVIVRRFFVAAGRHFNPGDTFDWKRMSVDQRRVRLLFEAGKLMHDAAPAVRAEVPTAGLAELQAFEMATIFTSDEALANDTLLPIEQEMADEDTLRAAAGDGLDDLNMKDLRAIAEAEGAPYRVSRDAQREAIREHRRTNGG